MRTENTKQPDPPSLVLQRLITRDLKSKRSSDTVTGLGSAKDFMKVPLKKYISRNNDDRGVSICSVHARRQS